METEPHTSVHDPVHGQQVQYCMKCSTLRAVSFLLWEGEKVCWLEYKYDFNALGKDGLNSMFQDSLSSLVLC